MSNLLTDICGPGENEKKLHLENCEESISLTLRIRTIKNARKKLETSVAPAVPYENVKKNVGVVDPTKLTRVWEIYQIIMKTTKQEKKTTHCSCVSSCESSCSKSSGGQGKKISAWNLTKVRSKKQVVDEAQTSGAKVHFASLLDICHLKNAELEAKHKGR